MGRWKRFCVAGALALLVPALAAGPAFAAKGGNKAAADACNQGGFAAIHHVGGSPFASQRECVGAGAKGEAGLGITSSTYSCGNTCWGAVVGFGLAPQTTIRFFAATPLPGEFGDDLTDANGNVNDRLDLSCGSNWTGVYATATTADGSLITSNVVNTPCG
jgi:hypothetical protein